jgi:predicted RNA-binding Zn-ribbon protein involved in translation (DUF1610 family)
MRQIHRMGTSSRESLPEWEAQRDAKEDVLGYRRFPKYCQCFLFVLWLLPVAAAILLVIAKPADQIGGAFRISESIWLIGMVNPHSIRIYVCEAEVLSKPEIDASLSRLQSYLAHVRYPPIAYIKPQSPSQIRKKARPDSDPVWGYRELYDPEIIMNAGATFPVVSSCVYPSRCRHRDHIYSTCCKLDLGGRQGPFLLEFGRPIAMPNLVDGYKLCYGTAKVKVPALLTLIVLSLPGLVMIARSGVRQLRIKNIMSCRSCGYNVFGNTTGACPECGTRIPEDQRSAITRAE